MLFLYYLLLLTSVNDPSGNAGSYSAYASWLDDDFIKVGLKKPVAVAEMSARGTLLVLDGKRVVDTIRPNGRFFVMANRSPDTGKRYVQVAASGKKTLEGIRKKLAAKYENLPFIIVRANSRLHALRVGPLESKAKADRVRKQMIAEGYKDAFINRASAAGAWVWVDGNFDKHVLPAIDLALVRSSPNDSIRWSGNGYRGILRFSRVGSKVRIINELPLETYLRGVVPTELGPKSFPELEAIKAQAVAARTYAIKNMGRFQKKGYDICDTQACQAYEGTTNEDPMADRAVRETRGLVLYYGDQLIDALYTSTCGGATDDVENVFPGRNEPYLRGKSSYVADYPTWRLPKRKVDRGLFEKAPEDLAVRLLFYGFKKVPDLNGNLSGNDFAKLLKTFSWILGEVPSIPRGPSVSHEKFWRTLSKLSFLGDSLENQVTEADLGVLLRHYTVPSDMASFAGLLVRYDLVHRDLLETFTLDTPVEKAWAHELLLSWCQSLGPEIEWKRYRLEEISGGKMVLSRGKNRRALNLETVRHYITDINDRLEFVDQPVLEEWDRIYLLQGPFPSSIIRVKESGVVASVDRFSAFDTWKEKKGIDALNRRAKRYVRGLGNINDVRVVRRAASGRVTLLEFDTDKGKFTVKGLRIRWSLGVKDNLFDLVPTYRGDRLVHLTVLGRGWGHGVGMSQVGAFGMARMGWTFDKILTYYYTDVELRPWGR
ncbi:MAG: SpoIID/LytB domain-containing protein [Acidobacteriota bacterium]|nr:SpoIID/LytB domain-containing protein [Acidobacteriota bacterium]